MTHGSDPYLAPLARELRRNMTDAERRLWSGLRRCRLGVRFLRQRAIGDYIVDFVAPSVQLVVEVDGGQHHAQAGRQRDALRDAWLASVGFLTLRFDDRQALLETRAVLEAIAREVERRAPHPPAPAARARPPSSGSG